MEDNAEDNLSILLFANCGILRFQHATWYTQFTDYFYFMTAYSFTVQPWSTQLTLHSQITVLQTFHPRRKVNCKANFQHWHQCLAFAKALIIPFIKFITNLHLIFPAMKNVKNSGSRHIHICSFHIYTRSLKTSSEQILNLSFSFEVFLNKLPCHISCT